MKLRLSLLLFCLLGIGVFSHAQDSKKTPPPPPMKPAKPTLRLVDDSVTVKSSKKGHWKVPPPPPKVEAVRFTPPKIVKDVEKVPPPPPPAKPKSPIKTDAPPKDPKA